MKLRNISANDQPTNASHLKDKDWEALTNTNKIFEAKFKERKFFWSKICPIEIFEAKEIKLFETKLICPINLFENKLKEMELFRKQKFVDFLFVFSSKINEAR